MTVTILGLALYAIACAFFHVPATAEATEVDAIIPSLGCTADDFMEQYAAFLGVEVDEMKVNFEVHDETVVPREYIDLDEEINPLLEYAEAIETVVNAIEAKVDYYVDNYTIRELKKMASEHGIKRYSTMNKQQLSDAIHAARSF